MRLVTILSLFTGLLHAEGTIVLEFDGPHSERTVTEMKREFEGIVKDAPITVSWRTPQQAQQEALPNLVVVHFKGKCVLEPVAYLYDERGPMAFTYSTGGVVQPFSDVAWALGRTGARSPVHALRERRTRK